MSKVIHKYWFTHGMATIGIVVLDNHKAYIGLGGGNSEAVDVNLIKEMGARIRTNELREIIALMEGTNGDRGEIP